MHCISIHAPLWDATVAYLACPSSTLLYFNPRAPVGRDLCNACYLFLFQPHFNPRAPVGRDSLEMRELIKCLKNFNPRAPVGRDNKRVLQKSWNHRYFNPRAPVGRDDRERLEQYQMPIISIHAPLWDATGTTDFKYSFDVISIHAPLWDATAIYCIIYYGYIFLTTILIQSIVKKTLFLLLFT